MLSVIGITAQRWETTDYVRYKMPRMKIFPLFIIVSYLALSSASLFQEFQPGCDEQAALACESDYLQCRLFTGPANDPTTMCNCGEIFFGQCLREAGCQTHMQASYSVTSLNYMTQCTNLIRKYNCPSTLMCSLNCATEGSIYKDSPVLFMPFNNYGPYYLRIRLCTFKTHPDKLSRFSYIDQTPCKSLDDFLICSRWVPPLSFVLVAFITNTTYLEVDSCRVTPEGQQYCLTSNPAPVRVYGNSYMFPVTFDVAQTEFSICRSDADCLGSYCDTSFLPPVCSPKSLKHVKVTGKEFFSDPFS